MTELSELNFVEYSLNQDFLKTVPRNTSLCVCCLDQSGPLINLGTCLHKEFLDDITNIKCDLSDMAVCLLCHRMLAKIHTFRRQVMESLQKLSDQVKYFKANKKINNLEYTKPHGIISVPETTSNLKHEDIEYTIETYSYTHEIMIKEEVDNDDDISEEDINLPLSEIKKEISRKKNDSLASKKNRKGEKHPRQRMFEKKYEGKIALVTLTLEQLQEERESDRLKGSYMKLPYKCEQCIRGFDHDALLLGHIDKQHTYREDNLQCDICKCYLSSSASLAEHCRRHFKRYECVVCGKRNNTLPAVITHYNECHGGDNDVIGTAHTCHQCGAHLASNRAYRYHMEKHKGKEQCSECEKTFMTKHSLKIHMFSVHNLSSRVYTCEPCNKTYRHKTGLRHHMASYHGTHSAYCAPCGTHYRTIGILKQHLRTHTRHVTDGDKRFTCSECGDKFLNQPALTEHIDWVHLKTAQHACDRCDKVFKNKSSLRKHSNFVHEKKRPPRSKMCDHCGRGFTSNKILRTHIRTHTGERPLQCQHCDATFAHPAALYTHNKLVHAAHRTRDDATVAS